MDIGKFIFLKHGVKKICNLIFYPAVLQCGGGYDIAENLFQCREINWIFSLTNE